MRPPHAQLQVARQLAESGVDAYEAVIRVAADALVTLAHALDVQPIRGAIAVCADVTRDLGAVQVSAARWVLDA